jgi:hypothetical protein
MFEKWRVSDEYPTLFLLSRPVWVDTARVLPASGIRQDELPLWVRAAGLRVEPRMLGRQTAWLRRSDGGWQRSSRSAQPARTANLGLSTTLWLTPEVISPAPDT